MSMKSNKKGRPNQEWMAKRGSRSERIEIKPEYHLIVTEGEQTEPKYFEAIKDEINQKYGNKIKIYTEGAGNNTVEVFKKAKEIADKDPNRFKHVWVVYDTDDNTPERINLVLQNCRNNSSEATEYHAIWSNQCIELWFLLHFEYYHTDIDRNAYYPKLTWYLQHSLDKDAGEYHKSRDDMYQILKPHIETAIKNARKLAESNKGKTPALSAPGTEVYQIIEKLNPFLDIHPNCIPPVEKKASESEKFPENAHCNLPESVV